MASHSEITRQLLLSKALKDSSPTREGTQMGEWGLELWIEAAREAGILKGPTKVDWSLLQR